MSSRLATGFGVVVVAVMLATASAWWMVLRAPQQMAIVNGAWRAGTATGSVDAGMYARAHVALTGLFALSPAEAIYFSAVVDDAGRPLRARCTYAIEGQPVGARWWSITAYGDDHFLIPNAAGRFSFNMGNLAIGQAGTFRIIAAPNEHPGHWLPTGRGDGLSLLFRIYNATPETLSNLSKIALPSVAPVGACAE